MDHLDATTSDADLARSWSAGDERGFDALVTRYAPLVYHRCRRALGPTDADDASQAVFLILARKREQATACPALAAWLMTVTTNVIRNAQRDRARRHRAEQCVPPPPAQEPDMPDVQEHLDACLAQLPAAERDAVTLHHLAGHSLVEVARHQRAGLSTVKDRLQRGLARLRAGLMARGVTLSVTALATSLQAAGQESVPASVMVHLRDLTQPTPGAATTTVPSERARRWSREGLSAMTRIALAGSALLLVAGTVAGLLWTGEAPATPAPIPPAPTPVPSADPWDFDPEHARSWILVRANDGARTVSRLRRLPEFALMTPEQTAWLDEVATIRAAAFMMDQEFLAPSTDRITTLRLQRDRMHLPPQERTQRYLQQLAERSSAAIPPVATDDTRQSIGTLNLRALSAWMVCRDAQSPILGRLRTILSAGGSLGEATITSTAPDSWLISTPTGPDMQVVCSGSRMDARRKDQPQTDPLIEQMQTPVAPAADIEASRQFDPGLPGVTTRNAGTLRLQITDDGLRLSGHAPWSRPHEEQEMRLVPRLDLRRLGSIPAQAFLVAAVPMRVANTQESLAWHSLFAVVRNKMRSSAASSPVLNPAQSAVVEQIIATLQAVDGDLVAWIEPGTPFPMFTVEADMPQADADRLLDGIGEHRSADGSMTTYAGMLPISLAYAQGRLVCTTHPAGVAGLDRSGGFLHTPEMVRALAALPDRHPHGCILVRPAALVASAQPYVGMIEPTWGQRITDYQRRLAHDTAYGYLAVTSTPGGLQLEASGLLSVIAAGVLANQAAQPDAFLRFTN